MVDCQFAPLARAKVTAERSLFELRSDVLDLVLNTEIAYWNLAYTRANSLDLF